MSEENFDNNIRKKLQSVKPDFSEDAWRKFRSSMPLPWYIPFIKDFGGWIYGGLASIALLGTIYTNYLTNKENELLHDKIITLQNNPVSKTDTVLVENSRVDTVYVVKYIVQKQNMAQSEADESGNPSGKNNRTNLRTRKGELPVNNDEQVTAVAPEKDAAKSDGVVNTSGNEEKAAKKEPEEFREKENKDEVKVPELKIPVKEELPEEKKKFRFPSIHARVGIGSDYLGFNLPAIGPDIEIFLNDRISFNTGLLISGQQTKTHTFAKDFNVITGKTFEDEYKGYIHAKPARIENISIKTSFIKLPLYFNYYIPASKSIAFAVSAGTKLDLSVYQDVSYTSGVLGDQLINRFEASPKPATFNSLFYGLGLQYKHKRLVAQFSPYFDFPFRNLSYGNAPRKFGINASLKIDLGKK